MIPGDGIQPQMITSNFAQPHMIPGDGVQLPTILGHGFEIHI